MQTPHTAIPCTFTMIDLSPQVGRQSHAGNEISVSLELQNTCVGLSIPSYHTRPNRHIK